MKKKCIKIWADQINKLRKKEKESHNQKLFVLVSHCEYTLPHALAYLKALDNTVTTEQVIRQVAKFNFEWKLIGEELERLLETERTFGFTKQIKKQRKEVIELLGKIAEFFDRYVLRQKL